jgi:Calx-beta domain
VLIPPSNNTLTVTVDYQTQDAGATAGVDYMPKVGKTAPLHLTFLPGKSTHKFVTVVILGDNTPEPTEGIDVVFSNPQNASFGSGSTGHIDILDND